MTAVSDVVRRVRTSRRAVRVTRYALGSVVALAASEVAFVLCYSTGIVGTTAASVIAFVAGAIPNYVLNRRWAWQRRGRVHVGREVFGYALVSLISLVAAAASTGWVNHAAPSITNSHIQRIALVAGTYLATYGVLFVLKFIAYELVIFARPVSPPRPPDDPRETQPIGEVATFFS